jgi:hypothetical protein
MLPLFDVVAAGLPSAHFVTCQIAGIAGEIGASGANFLAIALAVSREREPA